MLQLVVISALLTLSSPVGNEPAATRVAQPVSPAKAPWEWTVDERMTARLDPELARPDVRTIQRSAGGCE
jgi:hypothetical protein